MMTMPDGCIYIQYAILEEQRDNVWRETRERKAGMRLSKPELRVRELETLSRGKVVEGGSVVIVHKYAREQIGRAHV